MIPNVFVSSTIADLHYLREALRDAIAEISYNPVMSEHGGVGYIHEGSAADACYVTMKQCQIAILIVGKRYGNPNAGGLSVTHTEFRTAQANEIPLITFVDADVMSFKKVYDADPNSSTWNKFDHMDHPKNTFRLVDEVTASSMYNGLIEFRTATEAKAKLKQQLAHFMGDRLVGNIRPIKSDINEILAEVKAIRNSVSSSNSDPKSSQPLSADHFYISLRFLLDERNNDYTRFVEIIFGDLDLAARLIQTAKTIEEVIARAGATLETVPDTEDFRVYRERNVGDKKRHLRQSTESINGSWAIMSDKHIYLSELMKTRLTERQAALLAKLS